MTVGGVQGVPPHSGRWWRVGRQVWREAYPRLWCGVVVSGHGVHTDCRADGAGPPAHRPSMHGHWRGCAAADSVFKTSGCNGGVDGRHRKLGKTATVCELTL